MSFGAMAAWQAWALVVGAGAAAAWLFYLKVRPPRVAVPSLLLWRRVLDQKRDITWWERVRKAVSLALTVLVAAMLALAVTRPRTAERDGIELSTSPGGLPHRPAVMRSPSRRRVKAWWRDRLLTSR
jgi:hypothetical protein